MKQLSDFNLANRQHRFLARKLGFNVPKLKRGGGIKPLFEFVDVKGPDDCWEYMGWRDKDGYGRHSIGNGKSRQAHRVAWEIRRGTIPYGLNVLHQCDNPACCNPDHLFLGTHLDNVRDKVLKCRQAKGEATARVKLSEDQARQVKRLLGIKSGVEVSRIFQISPSAVCAIWKGRSWKHL